MLEESVNDMVDQIEEIKNYLDSIDRKMKKTNN